MNVTVTPETIKSLYTHAWETLKKDRPELNGVPMPVLTLVDELDEEKWASYRPALHTIRIKSDLFQYLQNDVLSWEQLEETIWHELTHVLVHGVGHPKRFWDILDKYGPVGKKITAYKQRRQQHENN